ncbi:MAG: LacI family DNA-binding transcriptional regulator [Bryobacteraceae bacterium]
MKLEEVAERAKVSTATVSRVLNDVGPVKKSTRARVLKAAEELKYHPNLHARTLAGGKSRTIGLIVSNMENPFFVDIYKTAERLARANGFEVVLANTDYRSEYLASEIRLMLGRRVKGLALVISEMDQALIQELSDSSVPVVFYDVGAPKHNLSNIAVNYAKWIERVVNYLYDLGHRRMAFISHHPNLGPLSVRERAFRDFVEKNAPAIRWKIAVSSDSLEGGREATREILASGFDPTAIISVNDFMALGALYELRQAGLRVPEDVSITGFDNIRLSEICSPPLTTLHIDRERIGRLMFQMLTEMPPSPEACRRKVVLEPEFVLRESTGPARGR